MITKQLNLYTQNKSLERKAYAVQYDTGRVLQCVISDCTLPTSGTTATIYAEKPSGKVVYNTATVSGNTVSVDLTSQLLAEVGETKCQIQVKKDDEKVTSFEFTLVVSESLVDDGAVESSNEFTVLEKATKAANSATSSAKSAATKANNAATAANAATENATEATTAANNAANAANTAASSANTAATKATTAATNADTATSAANTAATNATNAYEKLKDLDVAKVTGSIGTLLNTSATPTEIESTQVSDLSQADSLADTDTVLVGQDSAVKKSLISTLMETILGALPSTLTTTAKTIVGAINELKTSIATNTSSISTINTSLSKKQDSLSGNFVYCGSNSVTVSPSGLASEGYISMTATFTDTSGATVFIPIRTNGGWINLAGCFCTKSGTTVTVTAYCWNYSSGTHGGDINILVHKFKRI